MTLADYLRSAGLLIVLLFFWSIFFSFNAGATSFFPLPLAGTSFAKERSCEVMKEEKPLFVLILGQSNAGNHGESAPRSAGKAISLVSHGKCFLATDPLPGATGRGGSIWSRLPALLDPKRIAISLLAVESTPVRQWVAPGYLSWELKHELEALKRIGVVVDLVIWQQGEADAREGTTAVAYRGDFLKLRSVLRANGVVAPVMAALSTRCKAFSGDAVRQALSDMVGEQNDVWMGPDTDKLLGDARIDGCHFSIKGLDEAAKLWANAIQSAIPALGTNR
ncbi:MAG TPA: hypothetical protein VN639_13370 [Azonexus sp.]|nr:hypothetical protein [Azonexus sp.]